MRDSERPESDTGSSGEDCFGDVGFMFDNALPKTRRSFSFGDVSVAVRLVDDDPGAVQSGHYVWPAAPALSAYLVDRRLALPRGGRCLELGAGCGLAGLVAAQLAGTSAVVFTDHDPGVLDMIRESIAEQERDPKPGGRQAAAKCRCVPLSWGPVGKTQRALLADALSSASASSTSPPRLSSNPADDGAHRDTTSRSGVGEKDLGGVAATEVAGEGRPEAARPKKVRHGGTSEKVGLEHDDRGDCGDGGDGGGIAAAAATAAAAFDLVIASDVIYSVSVVRPLFQTVSDLLLRDGGPRTETRRVSAEAKEVGKARAAGGNQHGVVSRPPPPPPPPPPSHGRGSGEGTDGEEGGGADVLPVFLMSQSFGYDAETEGDIDRACQELGLVREVVWDELPVAAPTPAGQEQQPATQQQPLQPPQGDAVVQAEGEHPFSTLDSGSGGSSGTCSCCSGGRAPLLLSRQLRVGTKLQRFTYTT